jgi:hypothetical protein
MAGSATPRANASYWRGGRSRNRGTIAAVLSEFCAGPCRRQRRYRCARMGRYAGCSGRGIAPSGGQWVSPVPDSNVRILVEGTAVRLAAPRDRRFESIGEPDLEHSLAVGPTRALHHRAPPEGGAQEITMRQQQELLECRPRLFSCGAGYWALPLFGTLDSNELARIDQPCDRRPPLDDRFLISAAYAPAP